MFANKEISRKVHGPIRSENARHFLVWVNRERCEHILYAFWASYTQCLCWFCTIGLSSKCGLQRGVVLLQANISRSGPLVQAAPHWNLGTIIDSLCGHISRKSFTGTFFYPEFLFIPHAQWENYSTSLLSTC